MSTVFPSRRVSSNSCEVRRWPRILPVLMTFAIATVAAWLPLPSRAETTSGSGATAINSLPYQITSPGTYYLSNNLSLQNGSYTTAISITASNVTLDFNGHTLTDLDGTGNWDYGVYVGGNNVTVRGGSIIGFIHGVVVAGSNCLLEDLAIDHSTAIGLRLEYTHITARRCRVTNTGGSTYGGLDPSAYAILTYGDDGRIEDCDIAGVTAHSGGNAVGIAHIGITGMEIGNRISGCTYGLNIDNVSIKYRDNLCAPDVTTPYNGGTNAGNNG